MAFSTASDVESYTQINFDSSLETHLTNNLIPFVDAAIEQYVGYTLSHGTKSETFTGDQTKEIFLRHLPVHSITSVVEDDITLTEGNQKDFVFYDSSFEHPDKKLLRQKATAFVFPSILLHGIQPVTKGVRKCLVAFIEGPAWQ